jgi:YggT family protein
MNVREVLCLALNLYVGAIFVRIVLSWFPTAPGSVFDQIARGIRRITDPVLEPLRRVLPPLGPLDISPLIASFGLLFIGGLVFGCHSAL